MVAKRALIVFADALAELASLHSELVSVDAATISTESNAAAFTNAVARLVAVLRRIDDRVRAASDYLADSECQRMRTFLRDCQVGLGLVSQVNPKALLVAVRVAADCAENKSPTKCFQGSPLLVELLPERVAVGKYDAVATVPGCVGDRGVGLRMSGGLGSHL